MGTRSRGCASVEVPRFECSDACMCEQDCPYRQTQRPLAHDLEVFATSHAGWAARTLSHIPSGSFVTTYAGEVLSRAEASKRMTLYDEASRNYLLLLREHFPATGRILVTHVDATDLGNVSRFFNHSCSPNLVVHPVRSSFIPVVGLFAQRDIAAGEELTFAYGDDGGDSSSRKTGQEPDAKTFKSGRPCHCGARHCRGYLPRDLV